MRVVSVNEREDNTSKQAHHTSFTMSALTAAGGIFGFIRARSVPSLVGGLAVSSLYGTGVSCSLMSSKARADAKRRAT